MSTQSQNPTQNKQRAPNANQSGNTVFDGQITGIAVTSGGTSVISSLSHGLAVNTLVFLAYTNCSPPLNGWYQIVAVTGNTFTVNTTPIQYAPPAQDTQSGGNGPQETVSYSGSPTTSSYAGTAVNVLTAGTLGLWSNGAIGPTAVEYGDANNPLRQTRLNFVNVPIIIPVSVTAGYGNVGVYTFPYGIISVRECVANLNFTTSSVPGTSLPAGTSVAWALGTVPVSGQAINMNGTTNINLLPGTGGSAPAYTTLGQNIATAAQTGYLDDRAASIAAIDPRFDGNSLTANQQMMYLNLSTAAGVIPAGAATILVNGFALFHWTSAGNFVNF